MGKKLPPDEMALYRRVDEILYYIWDPIGVYDSPTGRDEYQSYLPKVYELVKREAPLQEFMEYFREVREYMGLSPSNQEDEKVVKLLLEVKRELLHS